MRWRRLWALVPGVSRSEATITVGLFLGVRREEAARFSFLMSVPIIAGALLLPETASEGLDARSAGIFGTGFVSSAVVGYMAIKFILRFIVHHSLRVFAYYRFGLTLVVAVLLLFRTAQDL